MADIAMANLRRVFNWHADRDEDFKTPRFRGLAKTKPGKLARDRVLNDDELRVVWRAAQDMGPFGAFIRFTLLTATRRDEAAHINRREITGTDWLIPAERYK